MATPRPAPETSEPQSRGITFESKGEGRTHEWLGRLGDTEPSPYAAMTAAERIEMVWPITLAAWAGERNRDAVRPADQPV